MLEWETVTEEPVLLQRVRLAGGWLYRTSSIRGDALAYVPNNPFTSVEDALLE